MGGKKQRATGAAAGLEFVLDDAGVHRVEAHHRLVDDEHARIVQQPGGNRHPLTGAVAEVFDQFVVVVRQVKLLEKHAGLPDDGLAGHLVQLAHETQEFGGRQLVVKEREIGHVTDKTLAAAGSRWMSYPATRTLPAPGLSQTREHLDRRCLARAVRSEESEELALRDVEIEAVHRPQRAEILGEALGVDHAASRGEGVIVEIVAEKRLDRQDAPERVEMDRRTRIRLPAGCVTHVGLHVLAVDVQGPVPGADRRAPVALLTANLSEHGGVEAQGAQVRIVEQGSRSVPAFSSAHGARR